MGTPSMMMKTLVMTLTTLTTLMKTMKRICLRMDDMPIPRTRKTFLPSSRGGVDGDAWDTNPKEDEFTNCLAKPIMKYNGGGGGTTVGTRTHTWRIGVITRPSTKTMTTVTIKIKMMTRTSRGRRMLSSWGRASSPSEK